MAYLGETIVAADWVDIDIGDSFDRDCSDWVREVESKPAIDELREYDQWVAWKYVLKEGAAKPDKLPVNPRTGTLASHSDPKTWSDYDSAWRRANSDNLAGVGFVLSPDDDYTGVDLDNCRNPETGELEPWAQQVIDFAETYAEISPSGKGIRLFARGKIERSRKSDKGRVELYGAQRYLTITGNHIEGTPIDIRPAPRTIEWLIARIESFRSETEKAREEAQRAKVASAAPPTFNAATGERERTWAARALEGVAGDLASVFEGGRNHALNAAAYRMGRIGARGWIDEASVRAALEDACRQNGLWKDDGAFGCRASFNSGWRKGLAVPHEDLPEREEEAEYERIGESFVAALERQSRQRIFVEGVEIDAETGEVIGQQRASDANHGDASSTADEPPRAKEAPRQGNHSNRVDVEIVIASSLAGKPVPLQEWLIPDLIPKSNITSLYGDGGTGKSLLALQLAVATATNGPWIGFRPKAGKVLFVSAEDEIEELHRRLARICPRLEMLDNLSIIPLAGKDAVLAAPDGASGLLKETPLFKAIRHIITEYRPDFLVLDTLADLFGGDEIKKAQARQFINMLRGLAFDCSTTVLLLAHPSQAGMNSGTGGSGNGAWNNSVRSRLYFERRVTKDGLKPVEDDVNIRVLKTMKANRAAVGGQIVVRYDKGMFVREEASTMNARDAAHHAENVFLDLLTKLTKQGRNPSPTPCAPTYAPNVFAKDDQSNGISKRAFEQAMSRLFTAGRIVIEESGPPSKRRKFIFLAQPHGIEEPSVSGEEDDEIVADGVEHSPDEHSEPPE